MAIRTIDDFVKQRVAPQHQAVVAMLRKRMRESAPEAKEEISYGIPVWRQKRIIAVISPTKKDITFSFSRGAAFKDRYKLLQGVGKVSKHIKIKTIKDVTQEALRYYIKQAVALDAK